MEESVNKRQKNQKLTYNDRKWHEMTESDRKWQQMK